MNIAKKFANYQVKIQDKMVGLAPKTAKDLAHLDLNSDKVLDDNELRSQALEDSVDVKSEEAIDLLQEFKSGLAGIPNPYAKGYHSFAQVEKKLDQFASQRPDLVEKMSLGKTAEGRDIWALKISKKQEGQEKPAVVITGCHHAREWMTVEAPLKLVSDLLKPDADPATLKRLEGADLWVVPVVNPDGYEFSRNVDSNWRKNRSPLKVDQNGKPTRAIGVDLNRNYWDGKKEHFFVYRPEGDKPGNTWDDFSATSDNPKDETYRGPFGGSEPEVKAMLDLQLKNPQVKAVIDYHSYGDTILYPYGHTTNGSPNAPTYKEIGKKMQEASSGFSLEQSVGLYPASGTSDDTHDLNGILNYTIEMGRSFQPNPKTIPDTTDRVAKASFALIDEIITRDMAGTLPRRLA